jgi:hypothetical protein
VKNSPRAPLGPSDVLIEGMPFSGIALDRQKSAPASNEIYSDQLIELEIRVLPGLCIMDDEREFSNILPDEVIL